MSSAEAIVSNVRPLGFPWQTADPFLFCVHHDDTYPAGNDRLGPTGSLAGRNLGEDFTVKDGFRMYHGREVPGFPPHPHRGFETVTIARRGYIDHADSLGAAARFGRGDVQWMTAGSGIVHSEMFPLLDPSGPNRVELFQIWLNLPREDKLVAPHFAMFWEHEIPRHTFVDEGGRSSEVTLVAGALEGLRAKAPPPKSWAARADTGVAIWTIRMEADARLVLPPAALAGVNRSLYFFNGAGLSVAGRSIPPGTGFEVRPDVELTLVNGGATGELLLLQGKPIAEPVVQHGPFVMNSPGEIRQAMLDYQRTRFGGWPWPSEEPVHDKTSGRFAKHSDGRVEIAPT